MSDELTTLREQVAAVEAVLAEWEYLGSGEHGPFRPGAPVTIQNAVKAKQLRAALTSPGTALAKVRADALREVAEWLAGTGFPIDFNWPDDPPPAPLRSALIDVIHADVDGRWHGDTLTHDEAAGWIISEAGWPDEQGANA